MGSSSLQETMTVKKEVQNKNLQPSNDGDCVHNVKIKDPCNHCSEDQEHKTLERSAINVQQKENMKKSGESKTNKNDKINEIKTEAVKQTDSSKEKALIKPKEVFDTSSDKSIKEEENKVNKENV